MDKLTIMTWLWKQEKSRYVFSADDVNNWYEQVAPNVTIPHKFMCVTDMPEGIMDEIEIVPLGDTFSNFSISKQRESVGSPACYRRLVLFSREAGKILGERFVTMDLDLRVYKNLDSVFSRQEDFVIAKGSKPEKRPYCGTMWMMTAGARPQVYEKFNEEMAIKANRVYEGSDQSWLAYCLGWCEATWDERDGVYLRRPREHALRPGIPQDCRVMFFPGKGKWDRMSDDKRPRRLPRRRHRIPKKQHDDVSDMIKNPNGWQ